MRAGWCSIMDLDRMSLEDVVDWHDFLIADEEARAEAQRRAGMK